MKDFLKWLFIILLTATALTFGACKPQKVVVKETTTKVPPGQMKKATGNQSAKAYAPGQQKKQQGKR